MALFTETEAAFIRDETTVGHNNRWNYQNRIKTKTIETVGQFAELAPELVEYLRDGSLQSRDDMANVGWVLGELLTTEQRREVAAALLWGERRPDETDAEFLERFPGLIEEFVADLEPLPGRAKTTDHEYTFLREMATRLREAFQEAIEQQRNEADIRIAVPVGRVVRWAMLETPTDERPDVPYLLNTLYGPWDESVQDRFLTCRDILISLGMQLDVDAVRTEWRESPDAKWALSNPPREGDIEQYLAVINALGDEIEALVEQYLSEARIIEKDQLFEEAFDVLEALSKPGRDILEWDDLGDNRPEWNGHHTRTANVWSEERSPPLLVPVSGIGKRRVWELTGFGAFVRTLYDLGIERDDVTQDGIPTDVSEAVVEEALANLTEFADSDQGHTPTG